MNEVRHESATEDYERCGAKRTDGSGDLCRNGAGKGTPHPGYGRCEFHGGSSPSGIKAAERLMVLETMERYEGNSDDDALDALVREVKRASSIVAWLDLAIKDVDPDHEYVRKHERERQNLVRACKMTLDADIDGRRIRATEIQLRQLAEIIRRVFSDERLNLTPEQKRNVPSIVREHFALVDKAAAHS